MVTITTNDHSLINQKKTIPKFIGAKYIKRNISDTMHSQIHVTINVLILARSNSL